MVCVGRRAEPTEAVAEEVGGSAFLGDAQDRPTMQRLFETIDAEHGRLDGIVDIIAIGIQGGILTMGDDDWQWQFDNVLRHAYLALQIGSPLMAGDGGGTVTLVSSVHGHAVWEQPALGYAVAKAALNHLTRVTAVELGPMGIRVNAASPGLHTTPRWQGKGDEWYEAVAQAHPLRRVGHPSDVASVILFLASELSRNVTGQVLVVDGGLTLQSPPAVAPDAAGGFSRS
ncbi:glucose 1-dehydrogenase [Pseudonocardia xishanensis]|uniref:Glucose 1-dehydrogenase n=1 Tax=Pseudonocardia xishanensis TaxID=630995 RepID=A0ABP8RUI1_9PSEU